MQDIKTVVREFLLDNFVMGSDAVIADDVSFMKTHILDSTGFIELVTFIEETFDIKVADEEMVPENLDSLLNIEAYLERKGATLANT
jgi:acyl carrier protein